MGLWSCGEAPHQHRSLSINHAACHIRKMKPYMHAGSVAARSCINSTELLAFAWLDEVPGGCGNLSVHDHSCKRYLSISNLITSGPLMLISSSDTQNLALSATNRFPVL